MRDRQVAFRLIVTLATVLPGAVAAQGGGWQPPKCDLDEGHYLIRSARTYLVNAARTRDQRQRERDLAAARRVLHQLLDEGETNRSGTWYYFARYYMILNDHAGADTMLARASQLAPQCEEDVQFWRRFMWVPILNRAVRAWQANETDTAIRYFKLANQIYVEEPQAYLNLGSLYASLEQVDSAVLYLRKGVEIAAGQGEFAEQARTARFNIARLYHRAERHDSAAAAYQRYLAEDSTSITALSGLAAVLVAQGKEAEAKPIYDQIIAHSEGADPLDLFAAGTALFRGKEYERAAQAFELGLERVPFHRDGLYNLANAYLSLKNGEKMLPVTERLLEVDPLSKQALQLHAAAYQQLRQPQKTLELLEQVESMPLSVSVLSFRPEERRATLLAQVENHTETALPGPRLSFEFLNAKGEVVTAEDVTLGEVPPGETADFRLAPAGQGIVAWRYKVPS